MVERIPLHHMKSTVMKRELLPIFLAEIHIRILSPPDIGNTQTACGQGIITRYIFSASTHGTKRKTDFPQKRLNAWE